MRRFPGTVLLSALLCTGCPPNVQQQAGFRHSTVMPASIERSVGEVVRFEVRPMVSEGTTWVLYAHGLARFTTADRSRLDWTAGHQPVVMEAVVAPWDPAKNPDHGGRGWLTFGLQEGDSEALDVDLPVRPLPYREVAPVSYESGFSLEPRDPPLRVRRTKDRVYVTFLTPIGEGEPYKPRVGASLVETGGRHVLYAEVKTNFGEKGTEKLGHAVTFSYPSTVPDPVEVVVVDWVAHGLFTDAFDLHRITVSGGAVEAPGIPAVPSPSPSIPPIPSPSPAPSAPSTAR